jgi:hypothetical protein
MARGSISFTVSGDATKTRNFLKKMQEPNLFAGLESLGQKGVAALSSATPVDSGLTAASWSYEISNKNGRTTITWFNSHVESGVNIAIILQYGHGTGTGGYVSGRDYINPAIQPIFDQIAEDMWKKVTSA